MIKLIKGMKKPKPQFLNYLGKAVFVFIAWIILFSAFYVNVNPTLLSVKFKEGDISRRTIYAPVKFSYENEDGRTLYVRRNELITEKGKPVTQAGILKLEALNKTKGQDSSIIFYLVMGLLLLSLVIAAGLYMAYFARPIFANNKYLFLVLIGLLLVMAYYEVSVLVPLNSYFISVAGVSMLIAILLGANAAFITTMIISLTMGLLLDFKIGPPMIFLFSGSLAILLSRNIRKRFDILRAGFLIGLLKSALIICFAITEKRPESILITDALYGFGSGLLSAFFVMGLLPVFETLFNITTDVTLLELSDLNHPLLKELILKAPGTYHHSLIVGNLAEAACDSIKANSLLARVGSYYHDIGKIDKPNYFSENEMSPTKSKHDKLVPRMSALIIINHVKEGVELASKHKIPRAILDFIEQHHGTGLIYYFYQRALENIKDEAVLKEDGFRYPGPRPQTKEAAVVLLADSVEASSRTLANPTPSRIEALVQRIINNKFIDGQLDECDLSLKDLHLISESFTRILTGIFHSRVEYPEQEEKKENGKRA